MGTGEKKRLYILKLHRNEIPAVLKEMMQMDLQVVSFHSKHSLEDYFLSLTTGHPHVEFIKN